MNRTVYVCLGDRGKEAKWFNLSRYCFSVQSNVKPSCQAFPPCSLMAGRRTGAALQPGRSCTVPIPCPCQQYQHPQRVGAANQPFPPALPCLRPLLPILLPSLGPPGLSSLPGGRGLWDGMS